MLILNTVNTLNVKLYTKRNFKKTAFVLDFKIGGLEGDATVET